MRPPLTPAILVYGLKTIGDPQLSPDARHVLYALAEADPATKRQTSQLWRCDSDGANPRRLTWTGERNSGGRWSPDGTAIAFVADRPGQQQHAIVVMPTTEAGDARELTRHRQGIEALALSPDGTRLAYTTFFDPANPDETPLADGAHALKRWDGPAKRIRQSAETNHGGRQEGAAILVEYVRLLYKDVAGEPAL